VTVASAESPPAPASRLRRWRRPLSWGVSLVAISLVVWMLPIRDKCTEAGCEAGLLSTLAGMRAHLVALAFALYLLGTLVWAARWRALLRMAHADVTLRAAWRITLEAQAGGVLLPSGVGGDALRVAYVVSHCRGVSSAKIVASVVVDRALGLVTMSLLAMGAFAAFGARDVGAAFAVVAVIPVLAVVLWAVLRSERLAHHRWLQGKFATRFVRPVLEYTSHSDGGAVLARGVFLSLLVSAIQLGVVRLLVAALGATPVPEAWVYLGTTLAMMVAALPALPGGWGTADAAFVVFFARAGLAAPVAVAVCTTYRVFWYAVACVGAVSTLVRRAE
jgi:uncharacterized protein (TIRG00374 family)